MKNTEIKDFLNNNKKIMFCFLKDKSPFFPKCCVDSTLVLYHFLKHYFKSDVKIIQGTKNNFANRAKFHLWLEIDNLVIDITKFQFYVGNNKFKRISNDEAYDYCIEEIQMGQIIFPKEHYDNLFTKQEPDTEWYLKQYQKSPFSFTIDKSLDADSSFVKYLNECGPWLF